MPDQGERLNTRLYQPGYRHRGRLNSVGRAGEQQCTILGVLATPTRGIVVRMLAELASQSVEADRVAHGHTNSGPNEEHQGQETDQCHRDRKTATHGKHYVRYGLGESMFPWEVLAGWRNRKL